MPKSSPSAATTIIGDEDRELTTADRLKVHADALYRAACECSHQHERAARLAFEPAIGTEQTLAQQMCGLATSALGEIAVAYERAAARFQPETAEPWWRKANILWFAAREYQLHHQDCDVLTQYGSAQDASQLGDIQIEYELAASALLALRQAAESYRRARDESQ